MLSGVDRVKRMREFNEYPPSTLMVRFYTNNGQAHIGFFLKNVNKYVTGINLWKDIYEDQWYDIDEVSDWEVLKSEKELNR